VRVVEVVEGERIEVQLPSGAGPFAGAQVVNGERRALPVGSTFDGAANAFYWQPAAGFLGSYDLWFVPAANGLPIRVRVVVGPPLRMAVDTPVSGASVPARFVVAGWALDLAAADGSGIDTVHVWAYPTKGQAPVFLGVAVYGDLRPDVGAVYGEQMGRSSYSLLVEGLAPGSYDLVIYAHRAATGRFDGAQVIHLTVQ
jgi:hypothetical protein